MYEIGTIKPWSMILTYFKTLDPDTDPHKRDADPKPCVYGQFYAGSAWYRHEIRLKYCQLLLRGLTVLYLPAVHVL